jgi:hypothetical protein
MEQLTTSVFKFATVRNGVLYPLRSENGLLKKGESPQKKVSQIQLQTAFVNQLITINESSIPSTEKIKNINDLLKQFIESEQFIKNLNDFQKIKVVQDASPEKKNLETLYDNIVVRIFTKSNNNQIFKSIIDQLKTINSKINGVTEEAIVLISERLTPSFSGLSQPEPKVKKSSKEPSREEIGAHIDATVELKKSIDSARKENIIKFDQGGKVWIQNPQYSLVNNMMNEDAVSITSCEKYVQNQLRVIESTPQSKADNEYQLEVIHQFRAIVSDAKSKGLKVIERVSIIKSEKYGKIAGELGKDVVSTDQADELVQARLQKLNDDYISTIPADKYALVAGQHVILEGLNSHLTPAYEDETSTTTIEENAILVYANGCYLRFPFFVADLRVIEQLTVGYLPGEIAHINNTQSGEINTRKTRRLKRIESYESLVSENETFRETDSQSTEKFGLEVEASKVQAEESSWNVNASVTATWGPVTASVDGGYASSQSSMDTNRTAQQYAKEIIQKTVDRVSNRVKIERSTRTLEEFEENVEHVIDNTGKGTKSYVYRWLNKLTRATMKNYGKRLMLQLDISHPSHYYLSRAIQQQQHLTPPVDPRTDPRFSVELLDRTNIMTWARTYNAKIDTPMPSTIVVSDTMSGSGETNHMTKLLDIPAGYACTNAWILAHYPDPPNKWNGIRIQVGLEHVTCWRGMQNPPLWNKYHFWAGLRLETGKLPISIFFPSDGFILNIEVNCWITPEAELAWKQKAYHAIIEAYEAQKREFESELNAWNPSMLDINPAKKNSLIKEELKREAIRKMFRCNPFWMMDSYVVGQEFNNPCCGNSGITNGTNPPSDVIRFLETAIDWQNITYELHPYFYADKDNWADLLNLSDDDPHFEAFLKASHATIRIPIHRDYQKETAVINFIINNSIANYETIPSNMQALIEELQLEPNTTIVSYDLDGEPVLQELEKTDLGIFAIPTDLVILECGNTDGVKPIGFPMSTDDPTTDVIIPKQYSPAIIADSCVQ